jgi:hypothetical protein
MKLRHLMPLLLCFVLVCLSLLVYCSSVSATTPPPKPTPPPAQSCGDGVCDDVERGDHSLCPQDCADSSGETAGEEDMSVSPIAALQTNLAFILDGSGSMMAELPGTGKSKLAIAQEAMAQLIPQVPAEVNIAVWAYGHRLPEDPKEESCEDIENIFTLGPVDSDAYMEKMNATTGRGQTPISGSLLRAASDLPAGDFNGIILVSDGVETCGGDPCAVAQALKASDASITVHVVGYAVDEAARTQLQCVAQASGGTYHDAADAESLLVALDSAVSATAAETILRVEVAGVNGEQLHENLRLSEPGTKNITGGYVSWVDNPVPPGTYDLLVDTVPPSLYENLTIEEGSKTVVRIGTGAVQVLTPDLGDAEFDIFDATTGERLGHYVGFLSVIPGSYQVKVIGTGSPFTVEAGQVVQSQLATIHAPGSFTIFDAEGQPLGHYGPSLELLPGTYSLELDIGGTLDLTVTPGEDVMIG